ncbi:MAG: type II toxin-antitoxin system VapC family toxin, partial [Pseudonocardia sp.]|nr:type II toxin-antitoxin system VapC family toxin [Pseudonocardia sp.]
MTGIVLDAAALVHAFTEPTSSALELRERLGGQAVHAPHLLIVEIGSVARRLVLNGKLSPRRGADLLAASIDAADHLYAHGPLSLLAWSLRDNLSFYDATYVALAQTLDLTLVTADAR